MCISKKCRNFAPDFDTRYQIKEQKTLILIVCVMKKVLLIALVAVCAMGCCKKSANGEGQCCKEGEKTECCQKAEEGCCKKAQENCCQKAAEATDTTAEAPATEAAPAEAAE